MPSQPSNAISDRAAETRARILEAALSQFSAHGLAGARTEQIAALAGVNKALLYYYFDSKERLYTAALEMIAARVRDTSLAIFERNITAGERLLRMALGHFDRVLTQQEFQSLMQQEMIRIHRGESGALVVIAERVFRPVSAMFEATVREGIELGELIEADPMQILLAALGANVFFFLSGPVWKILDGEDRFSHEALSRRRERLTEFLGQALFLDRARGRRLAGMVLADTPMPGFDRDRFMRRNDERAE